VIIPFAFQTCVKVKSPSLRDRVSKEEWDVRVDLAAAYQLAAIYRWTDLIYTHFSARVPGSENYLINPYGLMFDEITASNLVKIDPKGNVLDDPSGMGYNAAGFVIHGCVHAARPEVHCVIHTHTRAGVAVSAMKCGLLPISQHAMRVQGEVTYHDYEGIALDLDERTRMARNLGKTSKAMILHNHGLLSCGVTVGAAFTALYNLETACKVQADVVNSVEEWIVPVSDAIDRTTAAGGPEGLDGALEWKAIRRRLDRIEPSYKT